MSYSKGNFIEYLISNNEVLLELNPLKFRVRYSRFLFSFQTFSQHTPVLLSSNFPSQEGSPLRYSRFTFLIRNLQLNQKSSPNSNLRFFDVDPSFVVIVDDSFGQRKSKSPATFFSSIAWLKDLFL